MILIDSSIWIDHIRKELPRLSDLVQNERACTHPFVIGEVALGNIKNRARFLREMTKLPKVEAANDFEVMALIEHNRLFGTGLGYVDCHLLASALMSGVELWSGDKRLAGAAGKLGLIGEIG